MDRAGGYRGAGPARPDASEHCGAALRRAVDACTRADPDHDGMVIVSELIAAVGNSLRGCR